MAQTIQILRTTTNTPPPTLLPGALSAELGTQTKLWIGAAAGNRLLLSTDPTDITLSGGAIIASAAPNAMPGSLWWDSNIGQLYIRYFDGNSTAWVSASTGTSVAIPIAVASGGTGAITAPAALTNLGAVARAGDTMSGSLTIATSGTQNSEFFLNKPATGDHCVIYGMRAAVIRWSINIAESLDTGSGNGGSNFSIGRWNDAGVFINSPISITRATGNVTFNNTQTTIQSSVPAGTVDLVTENLVDGYANLQLRGNGKHWLLSKRRGVAGELDSFMMYYNNGTTYAGPWLTISTTGAIYTVTTPPASTPQAGAIIANQLATAQTVHFNQYFDGISSNHFYASGGYSSLFNFDQTGVMYYSISTTTGSAGAVVTSAVRLLVNKDGVCQNTTGTWSAVSDAGVKEILPQPYDRGLDAIVALQPVQYRYTASSPFGADAPDLAPRFGLVAQQVEPHIPEVIGSYTHKRTDEDGKELEPVELSTLDPGALIYACINAIKELNAKVEALAPAAPAARR